MINIKTNLNFGSTNRMQQNEDSSFIGYYTKMFREDLDWDRFSSYLGSTYSSGAECDIFACSDGSEAYSLALKQKILDIKLKPVILIRLIYYKQIKG